MHTGEYPDFFSDIRSYASFADDMRKRLEYARENGCNTCMLTGSNEPQQNKPFLRVFAEVNKTLRMPFHNIEMQTTGAFIDAEFLDFFKYSVGLTTIAVSASCLDDDAENREMIQTGDASLSLETLCREAKKRNINLRLCLNMNDGILAHHAYTPENIIRLCSQLEADQITFRALWSPDSETEQGKWISEHVTEKTLRFVSDLKEDIKKSGKYLDTLE